MSKIRIQTTQNVTLDFIPASLGDRIVAHIIDWLIFIAWGIVCILLFSGLSMSFDNNDILGVVFMVLFLWLPLMFYDLLFEVFMNGQSIGKRAMKIRVINLDGTQPTLGAYLMRWLFRLVDTVLFGSIVALITAAANGKGQRIGDIAAGTAVVKLKQAVSLKQLRQESFKENYQVMFPQASLLSDNDITTLRAVLRKGEHNQELIEEATEKVKEVMAVESDLDDFQFLKKVLEDHTYLTTIED
ncbi:MULTISPECIES: RDD family protein [unclassified Arcicella]|uniref:RDD family protein n=1 Tax=unclassified Arcicella TaxID=2644986 RepID=UPI00285C0175|nr:MULTISPECIES: RDD family protein [unclassified Arcicella]MDR6561145.1 putative RDD family membrane protein YckC [Arcicella sp. BE51]MDR6811029.1 putative RDD family membrane protein YckC [Arcicella sp. BE140]MDR6822379.1 putative RDD family membrane protein YckC [Arcicella sp. BE139]